MRRLREALHKAGSSWRRPFSPRSRPGAAAIVALGFAWGLVIHQLGWAQLGHFGQVRAFADGQAQIDQWHWETNDKAWVVTDGQGHFYSVKSPGTAALTTLPYIAIRALGADRLARAAVRNEQQTAHPKWHPDSVVPLENMGYDVQRGLRVQARVEQETPIVWALTLIAAVIPGVLMLFAVRWAADRFVPGYGTAAAITLGVSTIVMTFSAEFFSHVISAALAFAAFCVLIKERDGPPRRWPIFAAGLLAGLAVTFEFQTGLVGVVLIFFALARSSDRLRRAASYAVGSLVGAAPMLAFNAWAFGNPLRLAYSDAVAFPGRSGHDVLGLNSDGFFGITTPRFDSATDLLFAGRGLLVLTPIVVMAVVGVFLMRRKHRAEANTILAIAAVYFIYNSGYWLPYGGGTPGPRFLIPALPFVAIGLAYAYRRLPALTLGLAIPSALFMIVGTLTYPLIGKQGIGTWADWLVQGRLEHTVLTALGVTNAWLALAPFFAAIGVAIVLAVRATPGTLFADYRLAVPAVLGWACVAALAPSLANYEISFLNRGNQSALWLVAAGALLSLLTITALRIRERRTQPKSQGAAPAPEPALRRGLVVDEPTS
jgi:hypothetical protein